LITPRADLRPTTTQICTKYLIAFWRASGADRLFAHVRFVPKADIPIGADQYQWGASRISVPLIASGSAHPALKTSIFRFSAI
jgi:hypothetical protein